MGDKKDKKRCSGATEVFSRVTGFYRPVQQWNKGKKEEFKDRLVYDVTKEDKPDAERN